MTNQEAHVALVDQQTRNDTFADMLFEHVYCDCDRSWTEAEAEVKRIREPALRSWQLAEAARAMSPKGKFRGRLRGRIEHAIGAVRHYYDSIMVVEGDSAPTAVGVPDGEEVGRSGEHRNRGRCGLGSEHGSPDKAGVGRRAGRKEDGSVTTEARSAESG